MSEPSRPNSPSVSLQAKGFFAALFDFSFRSFITLKFLKVIYAVVMILILLAGVFFLISGLSEGGVTAILSLFGVPVVTLLYLVLARIYLEIIALLFRIGENTTIMAQSLAGGPGPMTPPGDAWGTPSPPRE